MTPRRFLAFTALALMFVSAQAPLYLFASVPVYIYRDVHGADHWIWFVSANLLATAAISPFVGTLSDVFGRRWVAVMGTVFVIAGQILSSLATYMDPFIGGMTLTGVGAGISELTAIAGTAELAPVSKRGYYVALMVLTILPILPACLWAQLIASHATWRYIGVFAGGLSVVCLAMTLLFYSPPKPAVQLDSRAKWALLRRVDVVGGLLSVAGLALFEVGVLGGGYEHPWSSAVVLVPLILGVVFVAAFVAWEVWGAKYPMVPRRLGEAPRTLVLTIVITFISGANFFSVLMIWPTQAYAVYGDDPIQVGIRGMPFAFGVLGGACISLALISKLRGNIKWIIFGSSCLMTAGCGALAAATIDNINTVYALLFISGLGVGGLVVPASTITTLICPDDLIATITALTIAIRLVGGAIGYAIYYNVFVNRLLPTLTEMVGTACFANGITDVGLITEIIGLVGFSLVREVYALPGVTTEQADAIMAAGHQAFADSYPRIYYDISGFINDQVAVKL
ncbi:major facilitator superfamily domain-containing protein [Bombardia bombarda]|uniref:Major facilitator superfamily domain-containing protein n=1 Tax=Bombardia bombarda TaxID=252184 RepID=A0AA39WD52_9PEZI|nr:major facilitator superfamily domain-containing protein [Bombardia bombarda]